MMARCAVLAQLIRQQLAGQLLYAFTKWCTITACVTHGFPQQPQPAVAAVTGDRSAAHALLGLLRVSVAADVTLLYELTDAEIHQMVRTLKTERSAIKSHSKAAELTKLAAAVFAEANRRIEGETPAAQQVSEPVSQPIRRPLPSAPTIVENKSVADVAVQPQAIATVVTDLGSKFEMDQAHVEQALSQYQQLRLAAEETRLEQQAVRVAKAEAVASIGSSPLNLDAWSKILRPKHY